MKSERFRIPISLAMFIAFFLTASIIEVSIIFMTKYESNSAAKNSAEILFRQMSQKTSAEINTILESLSTTTSIASFSIENSQMLANFSNFHKNIPFMKSILDSREELMSIYTGFDNGNFHQLIHTHKSVLILENYNAPKETVYINRMIAKTDKGILKQKWQFLTDNLELISEREDSIFNYNPTKRPWYIKAKESNEAIFTNPYIFSSSKLPGLTCAKAFNGKQGVLGIDITLTKLSEILATHETSKDSLVWIMNSKSQLIAYKNLSWDKVSTENLQLPDAKEFSNPVIKNVSQQLDELKNQSLYKASFVTVDNKPYIANILPMAITPGLSLNIAVATSVNEVTRNIKSMAFKIVALTIIVFCILLPIAIVLSRKIAQSFNKLSKEARKIQEFDFSSSPPIKTMLNEVHDVSENYEAMKSTIQNKTKNLISTQEKLEMLVQEGLAISNEKELDKLITLSFETAQKLSNADGGVMYLKEDQKLAVELLSLKSESIVLGGLSKNPAPRVKVMPSITAFLAADSVLQPVCEAFNTRKIVTSSDKNFSLFPTGLENEPTDFEIHSQISVPIITQRDELLGIIQLFNPCGGRKNENMEKICSEVKDYVGFLASQVAVTLDNRNLIGSLKELFDSLVQVVASSIDAKSPYTAGHCARVPVIAEMLADAAHRTKAGPLKDFKIDSEDDKRQLWLASWLHDCGKVSTPEFVIDKSTKLETVYNRIHEIRTRFEVIYRDTIIEFYKKQSPDGLSAELSEELNSELNKLYEEFNFVAKSNEGAEFMTDEAKEKLKKIADKKWLRHFSDKIGISSAELKRKGDSDEKLPIEESLLSDKTEHLYQQKNDYSNMIDAEGNSIEVPEYEYNKGEVYNLCINRGTLTAEERFKINEHTLNSLKMLEKIPFPDNLSRVVNIATEHHETLNGTGYPFKKKKENLSIETRILSIADVFEALTASDRPYKKRKTLSEALKIMTFMRKDEHIDPDLFDIFLREGVYKKYAELHLHPNQIDVDDISVYLS